MSLIDFILNVTGVLLWLSFRALKFDPLVRTSASSLVGTLRRAEPRRFQNGYLLAALLALILFRGWFYFQIGPTVDWVPSLRLGAIALAFRSDYPDRIFCYSVLSFLLSLAVFYLWLLCLSLVNGRASETDPLQRLVRLHLGQVDGWPWPARLALPFVLAIPAWLILYWGLADLGLIPGGAPMLVRLEQAAIIGLGSYLVWKYLLGAILLLYLLNSYIYLGNHRFWGFVHLTGGRVLAPLRKLPLRYGKADFSPLAAIFLIFGFAELSQWGLGRLYRLLPF
jgi:uncharacterized protein YggT (Ycf19 family)